MSEDLAIRAVDPVNLVKRYGKKEAGRGVDLEVEWGALYGKHPAPGTPGGPRTPSAGR